MKNLTILFLFIIFFCLVSCGNSDNIEPTFNPQPQGETDLSIGSLPDSIKVETSASIKFSVFQKEHPEKFKITVDTITPFYYTFYDYDNVGHKIYWDKYKVYGSSDIKINGMLFSEIDSIAPEVENIISFSNPTAVGEYKIILNITDKYNRTTKQEITIKVFSPEVIIKFYDNFPGYNEINYFTMLNAKYKYNPLSSELKGIRVDTIYTKEIPKHGHPGEWTVPGQSIICYIGQEGGNDMQIFEGSTRGIWNNGILATTTTFATRINGEPIIWIKKQGFHGMMFETSTLTKVGTQFYTLRVVDKWGKEAMATIVYKAFGRKEAIPSHATPSDDSGMWWGHRIVE